MNKNLPRYTHAEKQYTHFAYEVGTLRFIPRDFTMCGFNTASNVAEHTFRTSMLAWLIAAKEGADTAKVTQISLVHDLPEVRTLDHGIVTSQYVMEREDAAASDLMEENLPEAYSCWQEYKARETLEAKVVKDADQLEVVLEIEEFKMRGANMPANIDDYYNALETNLFTETARSLFKEIISTHPMEWHDIFGKHKHDAMRTRTTHKLEIA